jgi:hypothetical protein
MAAAAVLSGARSLAAIALGTQSPQMTASGRMQPHIG